MADQKISQLNALVTWAADDEIAIVDTDLVETKRMTTANLKTNVLVPADVLTQLNLAAGTLANSLHAWWRDTTSDIDNDPYIQTGRLSIGAATAVTFDNAFDNTPRILTGVEAGNTCSIVSFTSVGVGGFTGSCLSCANVNITKTVNWCAIGDRA